MVATAIGLTNLSHAMVGSAEVLAAFFADQGVTAQQFWQFLLFTTIGNGFGGGIFVAALKYGHSTRGTDSE